MMSGVAHMHAHPLSCPGLCAPHADPEASEVTLFPQMQNGAQCSTALRAEDPHAWPPVTRTSQRRPALSKERMQLPSGTAGCTRARPTPSRSIAMVERLPHTECVRPAHPAQGF